MMLVPRTRRNYGLDLFDEFFSMPTLREFSSRDFMKTDIYEKDGNYIMDVDMPGVEKDAINIELNNGYMTVSTKKESGNEEKDAKGNIIHQERYSGEMSRSWYVGDKVSEEDIKASFKDGILNITWPKEIEKTVEKKTISIN